MSLRFAEGKVTQLRREFKVLLEDSHARQLEERLCEELVIERPDSTSITSVYFDKVGYPLAERTFRTPHDTLKVRTKEYFPDVGASGLARVVLEAKREKNGLTRKRRVWMPRELLSGVVARRGGILPLIVQGRLLPVLGVTYRRLVFQRSDSWRVTFDTDVCFHALDAATALGPDPLRRELLQAPFAAERRIVVEVKHLGAVLPSWLTELGVAYAHPYSKFSTGMAHLLGGAERAATHLGG